jgi:tRNA pseudouridine38-40 synthase
MVRAIVGTLVLLGRDQVSLAGLRNIIECKDRTKAGESVPACGLFLDRIDYPYPL